ncbi:transposase [Kitasatospora sp. NPDC001159]
MPPAGRRRPPRPAEHHHERGHHRLHPPGLQGPGSDPSGAPAPSAPARAALPRLRLPECRTDRGLGQDLRRRPDHSGPARHLPPSQSPRRVRRRRLHIDWDNQQAVCPAGKTSATWTPNIQNGVSKTVVTFAALDCIPCPFKEQCTSSRKNRRQLSLYPRELTEAIRDARNRQQTGTWQRDYALRAGVEGTVRQATHTTGLRRARYRGLAKTHLDHTTSATALNLIRLHSWWNGHPLDRANHSHLSRLQLSLTA